MTFKHNQKVMLIGDSITQDGRFDDPSGVGSGYVRHIHDYFMARHPELNLHIVNQGVSANRVTDLHARWDKDVIRQNPDWLSVSIGVNDVWRQLDNPGMDQVYPDEFERTYRTILQETVNKTDARLIIMEPTIIEENSQSEGNMKLKDYVAITKTLSKEFNAIHIPMHGAFIDYINRYPENTLTVDGVHMNPLGRMLMTMTWLAYIDS